ncbi:MAG: tRNA-uridine aminocarboxypropyltransferase [Rhodoferax sp.]
MNALDVLAAPDAAPDAPQGHALARLRQARLNLGSKPFRARGGSRLPRCPGCRLPEHYCLCGVPVRRDTRAGFCLLVAGIEALKPSNTGWLVADVVADTYAYAWQRTVADAALLALLADPQWQPVLVFPQELVAPERVIHTAPPAARPGQRPLFVLLDGTWSEASKMARKSPYLDALPVLSLQPQAPSAYRLRRAHCASHLCTAEVAAECLHLAGEPQAAALLQAHLALFTERYLDARNQRPVRHDSACVQQVRGLGAV